MNWDAIGAIGEILGAVAVFASLIYLSIQIRASNTTTRVATCRDVIERWNQAFDSIWARDTMPLMRSCLRGHAPHLDNDDAVFFAGRLSHMVNMHNIVVEVKDLLDPNILERINNALVWLLSSPGGTAWWEHTGYMFPNYTYIENLRSTHVVDMTFDEWDDRLLTKLKGIQSDA